MEQGVALVGVSFLEQWMNKIKHAIAINASSRKYPDH